MDQYNNNNNTKFIDFAEFKCLEKFHKVHYLGIQIKSK